MISQIVIAYLLVTSGFLLAALIYYIKNNRWNGYSNKQKIVAAQLITIIIAILLISVPDVGVVLKFVTGLEVTLDNSKAGFVSLGVALSTFLSSVYKTSKENTNNE